LIDSSPLSVISAYNRRLDFAAPWNVPPLAITRVASELLRHSVALINNADRMRPAQIGVRQTKNLIVTSRDWCWCVLRTWLLLALHSLGSDTWPATGNL